MSVSTTPLPMDTNLTTFASVIEGCVGGSSTDAHEASLRVMEDCVGGSSEDADEA